MISHQVNTMVLLSSPLFDHCVTLLGPSYTTLQHRGQHRSYNVRASQFLKRSTSRFGLLGNHLTVVSGEPKR
ncbi:hypothetical protein P692DRAFT_20391633 [Suillus brevipes Sb2]|nr:hypothetical protein P692DRAFT_20391633 [Suillus brevipes Sb2]